MKARHLFVYPLVFGLGVASTWLFGGLESGHRTALDRTPGPRASTGSVSPEPIRPYVLELGRTHATICWATATESLSPCTLATADEPVRQAAQARRSRFHRAEFTGLQRDGVAAVDRIDQKRNVLAIVRVLGVP